MHHPPLHQRLRCGRRGAAGTGAGKARGREQEGACELTGRCLPRRWRRRCSAQPAAQRRISLPLAATCCAGCAPRLCGSLPARNAAWAPQGCRKTCRQRGSGGGRRGGGGAAAGGRGGRRAALATRHACCQPEGPHLQHQRQPRLAAPALQGGGRARDLRHLQVELQSAGGGSAAARACRCWLARDHSPSLSPMLAAWALAPPWRWGWVCGPLG